MITCQRCGVGIDLNESGGFAQCKGGRMVDGQFVPNPPTVFIDVYCPHCGAKQEDKVLHG